MRAWLLANKAGGRTAIVVLVLAGALLGVAVVAAPARVEPRSSSSVQPERGRRPGAPHAFGSCAQLVRYGRRYLAVTHGIPSGPTGPVAGVGPVLAAPAPGAGAPATGTGSTGATGATGSTGSTAGGAGFSTTNDQEPGVDEPDTVKTDGSTIFAVDQNQLEAVDVTSGSPKLIDSLDLGASAYDSQLLLSGTHLIVISTAGLFEPLLPVGVPGAAPAVVPAPVAAPAARPPVADPLPYYLGGSTTLTEIDVSNPAAMRVVSSETIDGRFVAARQNGSIARIVISSAPRAIEQPILRTRTSGYVPSVQFHSYGRRRARYTRPLVGCGQIERPAEFSGLGMVTIVTFDIDTGLSTTSADALMADAQVVYGSQDSLYVASQRWINPDTPVAQLPPSETTQIDRFDATGTTGTPFVASGDAPGFLLNQFSLSEWNGYLRVASTSMPEYWDGSTPQVPSQSYVTVLGTSGSQLVQVGSLSGLGVGERIYSVRFVGDTGYVVTFHQVDPLYTIDLSDPTAPRVSGQLDLAGYSSYLQPLSPGLLLGIGQAVGATNEPSGAQLELFDVSVPGQPRLIQQTSLGQGSFSGAQYDSHAFLFWPATGLAVLPVQVYPGPSGSPAPGGGTVSSGQQFVGAIGFHIDQSGIDQLGTVSAPAANGYAPPITRALVVGTELYTVSDAGVGASSLDTLSPTGFAAFPAVTHPPIVVPTPGSPRTALRPARGGQLPTDR